MLKTCSNCGQNLLTEVDLFVYQHRPTEEYYSCGCKEQADVAEKCVKIAKNSCLSPPDGGSPTQEEINDAEWAAHLIRKHFNLAPNKL